MGTPRARSSALSRSKRFSIASGSAPSSKPTTEPRISLKGTGVRAASRQETRLSRRSVLSTRSPPALPDDSRAVSMKNEGVYRLPSEDLRLPPAPQEDARVGGGEEPRRGDDRAP